MSDDSDLLALNNKVLNKKSLKYLLETIILSPTNRKVDETTMLTFIILIVRLFHIIPIKPEI